MNRREFLSVALGAGVSTKVFALAGDKFRWAINTHMFTPMKPYPEAGIAMAARFGFHGVEPWANELQSYLTRPPEAFKQVLDSAGITISSIASSGEYFDTNKLQATLDGHAATAKYAAHFGVKALKANLGPRPGSENLSVADARILAKNLNEVGKRTLEHGVKFAFHPHAWTIVERRPELDMILEMTNPKLVYLTIDTCHASVAGIQPAKFVRDHYARVAHMHFKDTLPVWGADKGWKGPTPTKEEEAAMAKQMGLPPSRDAIYQPLGAGGVDFPAVMSVLRERNYDGWITLDFNFVDSPPGSTIENDMAAHRRYLTETLHASLTK